MTRSTLSKFLAPLAAIALTTPASAQIHSSVSRQVEVPADSARLALRVNYTAPATQAQVLLELAPIGIVPADASFAFPESVCFPQSERFMFRTQSTLTGAAAAQAVDRIKAIQAQWVTAHPTWSLTVESNYLSASEATILRNRERVQPDLFREARTYAQQLAAAGGVRLGEVSRMSSTSGGGLGFDPSAPARSNAIINIGLYVEFAVKP